MIKELSINRQLEESKMPEQKVNVAQKDNLGYYYPKVGVDPKTGIKIVAGGRSLGSPDQV